MAGDESVVVLGEDVTYGGPFGATKGLVEEFGESRVRNTPISEGTIMGMAVGAAASGLRPVLEIMFVDFITLAMDQLVNHAAKLHFMTGGQLTVPLTIRVQGGIGGRFGAHHSQSLESWFVHTPGLKVVAPAMPADATTLLETAIADDNPVVYLEHRGLYWLEGDTAAADSAAPHGAIVRRVGGDVTIVAYSRMVHAALDAAGQLADEGVDAEVLDLRWLLPMDVDAVVSSLRKTGCLVVAHEAVTRGGVGAEIVARVHDDTFPNLRAPIARVGAPFAPVGAAPDLEDAFAPGTDEIVREVRRLLAHTGATL
jgi:pyruvate dehydrogenase E1 component beta subunit